MVKRILKGDLKMKNFTRLIKFLCAIIFTSLHTTPISAQNLTVPDYAYGAIQSQYGTVSSSGITRPGPYGWNSTVADQRQNGIFIANGYRWWGYPSYALTICGSFPEFNFPGNHGIVDMSGLGCTYPPIGYMASWGGVIASPAQQTIWGLTGSKQHNGPTSPYCIPNPYGPGQICYPPSSTWGYGACFGYLRKVYLIQSNGSLQKGDRVEIKASLTAIINGEGEGLSYSMGILFANKYSEAPWYQYGYPNEYLNWSTMQDFLSSPGILAAISISETGITDSVFNMHIGDTILVEVGFNNSIQHTNPGNLGETNEGWAGTRPSALFSSPLYAHTDSIHKFIMEIGNTLTFQVQCLTEDAFLDPLSQQGSNTDEDMDGIPDTQEMGPDGTNNAFDGNQDGIPDHQQSQVASFATFDHDNYVTMVVQQGKTLSKVIVTDNPSPNDTPEDAEFPWGFFDFSIDGLERGEATLVTFFLQGNTTPEHYYKYGATTDNMNPHWYEFMYNGQTGAIINGNTITLHFVDGQRGDEDLTANGTIKEPGGPAKKEATGLRDQLTIKHQVSLYPNPVENYLNIQMQNGQPDEHFTAGIYTMEGKLVHQERLQVTQNHQTFSIDTNHLAAGVYLVKLIGNNITHQAKIIKLK